MCVPPHPTPPHLHPLFNSTNTPLTRIDVPTRLRRAIHLNDLLLVRRIIRNHPTSLHNPDDSDNGNSSLHLAARLCRVDIVVRLRSHLSPLPTIQTDAPLKKYLIHARHDQTSISLNASHCTPLHLACSPPPPHLPPPPPADREEVVRLFITHFSRCIPWRNALGQDALMLACQHPSHPIPSLLLATKLADPNMQDGKGNTALHHASAYGQLKTLRVLLGGGGRPGVRNWGSWGAGSYSLSVQAEVYWRGLVGEWERWVEGREGGGGGGVRLVRDGEGEEARAASEEEAGVEDGRGGSAMGFRERERAGTGGVGLGLRQGGRARAGTE